MLILDDKWAANVDWFSNTTIRVNNFLPSLFHRKYLSKISHKIMNTVKKMAEKKWEKYLSAFKNSLKINLI